MLMTSYEEILQPSGIHDYLPISGIYIFSFFFQVGKQIKKEIQLMD